LEEHNKNAQAEVLEINSSITFLFEPVILNDERFFGRKESL